MAPLELHSRGGRLWRGDEPVSLRGANWFGLETDDFCLHGLWCKPLGELLDFLAANGFNALRVPFSCELALNMDGRSPGNCDYAANPWAKGLTTGQLMDRLVQECAQRGLLIMLDLHRLAAAKDIPPLWFDEEYPEAAVCKAWRTIVLRYRDCDNVVAADLNNEPHGHATWGDGHIATDWRLAAERIGAVVQAANPRLLIFVEGVEAANGVHSWWGGNLVAAADAPVRLPVPDKLVYSPHVYGPSVHEQSYFADPAFPANLPPIWASHFGFLARDVDSSRAVAVVPGEWGGWAREGTSDLVWQQKLASWLPDAGIESSFYWCLNPNSGDTGGLLCDAWTAPNQCKLDIIARAHPRPTRFTFGQVQPRVPAPEDCEVETTVDPAAGGSVAASEPTAAGASAAAPPPAAAAATPTSPAGPLTSGSIEVTETNSWEEAGVPVTQLDVKVVNTGQSSAGSMQLLVTPPTGSELAQAWNCTRLPDDGASWALDLPEWCGPAGGLAPGANVVVGLIIKGAKPDAAAFSLAS